jgi:hypothetical protein
MNSQDEIPPWLQRPKTPLDRILAVGEAETLETSEEEEPAR